MQVTEIFSKLLTSTFYFGEGLSTELKAFNWIPYW